MTNSPLVDAAGDYLALGLAVIALTGKTPNVEVHRHGLHDPLIGAVAPHGDHPGDSYTYDGCAGCADRKLLAQVFEHPATTGIGILTRWPFVVVDIDGEEGAVQWAGLLGVDPRSHPHALYGGYPWIAATGRGLHLWFLTGTETGTIKLGPKLDLKGDGGYVAAPPSRHPDGHLYRWLVPPDDLPPPAPAPLAALIADHAFEAERAVVGRAQRKTIRQPRYTPGDTVFYAQLGYDSVIAGMATAAEGNRNNYLHWAAATLAEEGGITEDFDALAEAALAIGLEPVEVERTVRSARRRFGG